MSSGNGDAVALPQQRQRQRRPEDTVGQSRPSDRPHRAHRVPITMVAAQSGQAKTAFARSMLASDHGWALLPETDEAPKHVTPPPPPPPSTLTTAVVSYLTTARLHQDFLWSKADNVLCSVVAFSTHCQGPPLWVHGGCVFAVLEHAMTRFVQQVTDTPPARTASSGTPPATPRPPPLVMESMAVSYKGGAPIDAVHIVECTLQTATGSGSTMPVAVVRAVLRSTRSFTLLQTTAGDVADGGQTGQTKGATAPFAVAEARFAALGRPMSAL